MLKRLEDLGTRPYWITESRETKRDYTAKQPGIRVLTTLSSLGLEFKAILLIWVEQFWDCCQEDDLDAAALARRELYVAMTRAQDELAVFGTGNSRIVEELQFSRAFEIIPQTQVSTHSNLRAVQDSHD